MKFSKHPLFSIVAVNSL